MDRNVNFDPVMQQWMQRADPEDQWMGLFDFAAADGQGNVGIHITPGIPVEPHGCHSDSRRPGASHPPAAYTEFISLIPLGGLDEVVLRSQPGLSLTPSPCTTYEPIDWTLQTSSSNVSDMHAENGIALASFVGHNQEATPDTQVEKQTGPADVMLDDGFVFESGCRPISHEITEKEQTKDGSPSVTRLKCQHHNCRTSKRTFARKYELARHMKKHAPPISYPCPVLGCAYTGQNALYRPDKLKVHLRMSHTDDALCQCPVQACTVRILPLDLMSAHARLHRQFEHQSIEVLGGYKKNLGAWVARCPIGSSKACKKWTRSAGLSSHILGHSEEERTKFRTEFEEAGFDSVSGNIVCPICSDLILDNEEFATHIHTRHLLEPDSEGAEHFNACYEALLSQSRSKAGASWRHIWDCSWPYGFKESQSCPGCGLSLVKSEYGLPYAHQENVKKHLRMHKEDITEVIQHRRQILKHYPEIVHHPIFDDLRVTYIATTTTASH